MDARTEHMKDQFETAVTNGHLDCTVMAEKYPDWTAENIKDY